ncbi:MAG: CSLREA domain-containing protein [Anaerolineae bacterium]
MKHTLLLTSVAVLLLFIIEAPVGATLTQIGTTITVNTTDDELNADDDCSLREAIRAANTDSVVSGCSGGSGTDTIILPAGTYTLTMIGTSEDAALTGDLDITDDLTVIGDGASTTIIDGNGSITGDRVFHIVGINSVTFSGITIQNGNTGGGVNGGGLLNDGTLTMTTSIISNNVAAHGAGILNVGTITLISTTVSHNIAFDDGGGIRNNNALTVINSTIGHNTAASGLGGGIENHGTLTLANSTISGNMAGGSGGGIYNGYAFGQGSMASLNNVTLTDNAADTDDNSLGAGGGIYNVSLSTFNIMNTILAGNLGPDASPDCSGTLNSQGYNLIQSATGCILSGDTTGNVIGATPSLGALQDNGGLTLTHALLRDSPAVDAGNPAMPGSGGNACEATDQRGFARHQSTPCGMGAYESTFYRLYLPTILRD